jgi:hypothetical protein
MLTILITLLIAVVGLLMYALCVNPKLAQIGYVLFCIGAFWTTYLLIGQKLSI